MFATHLVLDQIPPLSGLSHIHTAQLTNNGSNQQPNHPVASDGIPTHYFVGAALPAIPAKLVEKIESGAFIELSDLLPEHLGHAEPDEDSKSKSKHRPTSSITQWLQCFAAYTAVISKKQPYQVMDLMGYQILIIEAYHEYRSNAWLNYDRRFHLRAASQPGRSWAAIDSTIWNLAFAGQAKATRCNHCFSFAHSTSNCNLSGNNSEIKPLFPSGHTHYPAKSFRSQPICYKWNNSKLPGCSHRNCRFEHICMLHLCFKPSSKRC